MAATKLALKNGKLLAAGGELMAVDDDGPCCLCEGCGTPPTHFVMTPPTVEVTLTGVTVNEDIDYGGSCATGFELPYPSCEQAQCEALNDTYELRRGIFAFSNPDTPLDPGTPHPNLEDKCNWSEFFSGFDCDTAYCANAFDPALTPDGGENWLRIRVTIEVLEVMGECVVVMFAETLFGESVDDPWGDFFTGDDNFAYYCDGGGPGGVQSACIIHTFAEGECVWKLEGSYTLVLEGGADPTAFAHPFCNWDAVEVEVNFG